MTATWSEFEEELARQIPFMRNDDTVVLEGFPKLFFKIRMELTDLRR